MTFFLDCRRLRLERRPTRRRSSSVLLVMTGGVMRRSDRCLGRRGRNGSIDLKAGFGEIFDEELGLLVAEGGLGVLVFDTEGGEVCLEGGEIGEERVRKGGGSARRSSGPLLKRQGWKKTYLHLIHLLSLRSRLLSLLTHLHPQRQRTRRRLPPPANLVHAFPSLLRHLLGVKARKGRQRRSLVLEGSRQVAVLLGESTVGSPFTSGLGEELCVLVVPDLSGGEPLDDGSVTCESTPKKRGMI
jgi:hypothetical protein